MWSNLLAMLFAVKAKCPIVPLMFLSKGKIFRRVHLIIGKPFTLEEFYGKKLDDEQFEKINAIVREKLIEQQQILIEKLSKKKHKKVKNENKRINKRLGQQKLKDEIGSLIFIR